MRDESSGEELTRSETPLSGRTWFRRGVTAALVAYWLILFVATHVPRVPQNLQPGFSDKWQHYLAYAVLGALLAGTRSLRGRMRWRTWLALFAVIAAYGALDELTQPLFGRDAELLDWRSDLIGGATGFGLFALTRRALTNGRRPTGGHPNF